jgi:hypothetical protein
LKRNSPSDSSDAWVLCARQARRLKLPGRTPDAGDSRDMPGSHAIRRGNEMTRPLLGVGGSEIDRRKTVAVLN